MTITKIQWRQTVRENRRARIARGKSTGATVVRGRVWHVPGVFLMLYLAAGEGFFSTHIRERSAQFSMLMKLLIVVIFGRMYEAKHGLAKATLRVATIDGDVVGHTLLVLHPTRVDLFACAVQAAFRRHGIGKLLVEDVLALAGKTPVDAICLPKAHAMGMLLRGAGFSEAGRLMVGKHVSLRHWRYLPGPSL